MNIEVNKLTDVKTEIGNLQVIYLEGTNVPDGKYFVAKSLCKALGYSNPTKEIERIPHDYKIKVSEITRSPLPKGGLYDLVYYLRQSINEKYLKSAMFFRYLILKIFNFKILIAC